MKYIIEKDDKGFITIKRELIECKDCKEYQTWNNDMKICMRLGSYYGDTKLNDYCSYAVKREEE